MKFEDLKRQLLDEEEFNNDETTSNMEIKELFDTLADELENDVAIALVDVLETIYDNSDESTRDMIEDAIFEVYGMDDDDMDESEVNEAGKKIKRDKIAKLKSSKKYRSNKNKIKHKAKLLRKTSKYKKYVKKTKRMKKRNLTSTGKRVHSWI